MTRKGISLTEVLVVVAVLAILAAVGVVWLVRSRVGRNETNAVTTLRTLVTKENLWHKQDMDGNKENDYWAIDVAGMYRALRQPQGMEAAMIDLAVAQSDWSPDGKGDGGDGEFPIVTLPYIPDRQVPGLGAMNHAQPIPHSGYFVAAFREDATSTRYAVDMDGVGQAYENTSRFAFMAFPEEYDVTGRDAFIVEAAGVIWRGDAVTDKYNSAEGPVLTLFPTCPRTKWPRPDVPLGSTPQAE
ncbi:MAG: prepilin-type N-terminal cleavage/methylation domain-containing protein [Planctomycetota bacterium]|nr:prepilin-type N-terminal cleavage/methylation domain-containing protein [Planctomycetota bacterium]